MQIADVTGIDILKHKKCQSRILLWEKEKQTTFSQILDNQCKSVFLVTGPEGGFHQKEIDYAAGAGFSTVSLGQRILRAETAAVASLSIVQYIVGGLLPVSR
jgi:16S rRNA (uracil1498-N3)-methyltransferase